MSFYNKKKTQKKIKKRNAAPMPKLAHDWSHLYDILFLNRSAGSVGEKLAISRHIAPICDRDEYGNYIKIVGDNPTIIWSSHTDTVHTTKSSDRQELCIDGSELFTTNGTCLGADCGAGMAIMLSMIKAGVSGIYVFHREEEIGGIGSQFIADNPPAWIEQMECCIAFDRYGFNQIITHQGLGRCCSDEFATSLADQLNQGAPSFNYRLNDGGTFTDSANYVDLIGECTNISVGYLNHHTREESQCLYHLDKLLTALINLDQSKLVYKRQPGEIEPWHYYNYGDYGSQGGYKETYSSGGFNMISDNVDIIEEILLDCGYDLQTLEREIEARGGFVYR